MNANDDRARRTASAVGRRDLFKLGAGVVATALNAPRVKAQGAAPAAPPTNVPALTRVGYVNDYNRAGGNGPMDDTTRTIVSWVTGLSERNLTDSVVQWMNRIMVDSMAALISGFESEPVRIGARLARSMSIPQSTVLGYGIMTTPEVAAFTNSAMVRHTDFNDMGAAGKSSNLIPAVLALGELTRASGPQVMVAIAAGYECAAADGIDECGSAAMAAGKLLGLNEDQLANALTLAVTPHNPLNKGAGAYGMWKGVRSAQPVKDGVWAALMAREGMVGPPQPFEGVGGRWALYGRNEVKLPTVANSLAVERQIFKRRPVESSAQGCLEIIPEMRAWTSVDEIASILYQMPYGGWREIGDAPKFDPRNREMADHSMPYVLARALIDGDIYLDSFTEAKYMDPVARSLMAKMNFAPVAGWSGLGPARITIRKKNGEQKIWDTLGGLRNENDAFQTLPMTDADVTQKFNRVCAFMKVSDAQRDRARAVWGNLRAVKDIREAVQTLAKFGEPRPL